VGLSCRIVLLDVNDGLYRLPFAKYDQMLRNPSDYCLPRFAGTRTRMAEGFVELQHRRPTSVIRINFSMIPFDRDGRVERGAFDRVQRATTEEALAPAFAGLASADSIRETANRFVARGGRWIPSSAMTRRIADVMLERVKCARL
jgi:hypothetical protein